MSGGIIISPEKSWIKATWVYRHLMEYTQRHVSKVSFPNLYSLLSVDENPLHFIFFDELTFDEKQEFLSSIRLAYADIIKDEGEGFASREYYLNYLERLKELIEMLPNENKKT